MRSYYDFTMAYLHDREDVQEMPEGVYGKLKELYELINLKQENKYERKKLESKKKRLETEIQSSINERNKQDDKRNILLAEKNQLFETVLQDDLDIEAQVSSIDEQIKLLESSISGNEKQIIEKKKELITVKEDLLKNTEKGLKQKEEYISVKETVRKDSSKINKQPLNDFEKADISTADSILKDCMVRNGTFGVRDVEKVKSINSTAIVARSFQEQAKYERKAAMYAKQILEQIDNKTLSIKDFGNQMDKFSEVFDLLKAIGYETMEKIVQQAIVFNTNKDVKVINNELASKDYNEIDKVISAVDKKFNEEIQPQDFNKTMDNFMDYRENAITDYEKTQGLFTRLFNPNKHMLLEDRIRAFDGIVRKHAIC